jgi:hypothetical protein
VKRKLYPVLRDVHLTAGLFSMLFVLMYGWSSLQFSHPAWADTQPVTVEWQTQLAPGLAPRDAAQALRTDLGLQGDLAQIRQQNGLTQFRLVKPGVVQEVRYEPATGATRLKTNRWGWAGMMNRLHTAAGLWHEDGWVNLYGWLVGLVSFGLLLLGSTGLYLWFVRKRERKLGIVMLAISLLWGLGTMVAMRVA